MHSISYKRDDRLVLSRQNERNLQDEDIGTRQRFSIYPDYQNSCWKGKHPKISACYIRCSSGSSKFRIFFIVFITGSGRFGGVSKWNTFPSSHEWRSFMVFGKKVAPDRFVKKIQNWPLTSQIVWRNVSTNLFFFFRGCCFFLRGKSVSFESFKSKTVKTSVRVIQQRKVYRYRRTFETFSMAKKKTKREIWRWNKTLTFAYR